MKPGIFTDSVSFRDPSTKHKILLPLLTRAIWYQMPGLKIFSVFLKRYDEVSAPVTRKGWLC